LFAALAYVHSLLALRREAVFFVGRTQKRKAPRSAGAGGPCIGREWGYLWR